MLTPLDSLKYLLKGRIRSYLTGLICPYGFRNVNLWFFFLAAFCANKTGGSMEEIKLPNPNLKGKTSVEECILKRRSKRSYFEKEPSLEQISQLCWAAQGLTEKKAGFRSAPSAGALYPLELYLVKNNGLFRYIPEGHKLVKLKPDDLRDELCKAALYQEFVKEAPLNFIITAVYSRTTKRYGERGVMYVHIEVGHVAENIHLQSVALGLGSVPIGAFYEDEVKKVLSLPEEETPLYIIPVGYPKD